LEVGPQCVYMIYFLIFIFGLAIGSFLNVVIFRLGTNESILVGRSHCPKCGAILKWYDLIPALSFLIQKGKCRYCEKKISFQYPIVEISTGSLFVFVILSQQTKNLYLLDPSLILRMAFYLIIICFLIVIFVYDLRHYLILDKIVFPAIIIVLFYQVFIGNFLNPFLSALLASGFFLSLVLISKGKWMGMGDVKFAILMGLILGWPNILLALFLSFFSGAIIGIVLILFGKKGLKSQIPFGPFLVGSTILIMLYGEYLNIWYYNLLF